jgi:putative selenium metabolism hydrolase
MKALRFDEVWTDEAGNVIGRVRGAGAAPAVMLNTHLDHVDAGDPGRWPHPPYDAVIAQERVWGRATVDIKGPLAAQVHGVGALSRSGRRPPGDVYVSAVVQEEVGGIGAQHLAPRLETPLVIIGEPSSHQVRCGHRGRGEIVVGIRGRSVHASVPDAGRNPYDVLGRLLVRLPTLSLESHDELGRATLTPTLITTDTASPNMTPGEIRLMCDCRTVPGQPIADVRDALERLAREALAPGFALDVSIPERRFRTYTGLEIRSAVHHPAFLIAADHPAVEAARRLVGHRREANPGADVWRFATDGGHFADAGRLVIGFGPGDEALAHTTDESIEIAAVLRAVSAYSDLAMEWPSAVARLSTERGSTGG